MDNMVSSGKMIIHLGSQLGSVLAIHPEVRKRLQEPDNPERAVEPGPGPILSV